MSDASPNPPSEEPTVSEYTAATASTAPTASTTPTMPTTPDATRFSGSTAIGAEATPRRSRPIFGTIFWGVVLLTFAAFMVVRTVFPVGQDPTLWLVGSVIVIGLLLLVAGIAAASRRAG